MIVLTEIVPEHRLSFHVAWDWKNGKQVHGLNDDILVWNPVSKRRYELTSIGIRVTKDIIK